MSQVRFTFSYKSGNKWKYQEKQSLDGDPYLFLMDEENVYKESSSKIEQKR